jgi:hypothetical protein
MHRVGLIEHMPELKHGLLATGGGMGSALGSQHADKNDRGQQRSDD